MFVSLFANAQYFWCRTLDSDVFHLSCLHVSFEGVMVAECVEGKRSRDAVPLDNLMEVSTDTTPEVRSLVTSQCTRDVSSSETFVLRSVLKKTSVKLFPEGLQVSLELLFLKQIE